MGNKETIYLIDSQIVKIESKIEFIRDYINSLSEEIEDVENCITEIDCLVDENK